MNLFFYTFVQILTVYIGQNNKLSLREYVLYVSFSFIDILFQGISHKSMFLEVPEKPSERFIFFFGPPDLLDILFRRIGSISVFPIVLVIFRTFDHDPKKTDCRSERFSVVTNEN